MQFDLSLYGITDGKHAAGQSMAERVEQAILGGVTILQYREKNLEWAQKKEEALEIQRVCKKYGVPFLINDDVTLAIEIDADGVHLGQKDMNPKSARELLGEDKIIGVTAKTIEQALLAQEQGADYLGSGAVFGTSTKLDALPMEHDLLDQICESVSIPVVAIGGIDANNIEKLQGRKMQGFAVVSGIFGSNEIRKNAETMKEKAKRLLGK